MYGLIVIACLLGLFAIFLIWQFFNLTFHGHDPLFTTNKKLISQMIDEFCLVGEYTGRNVYELGCGQAPFLSVFSRNHPRSKCVGVEKSFLQYVFAKTQSALHGGKIKILKNDLFHIDIRNADLIYCYLDRKTMVNLGRKIKFECRPGTKVISNKFPIPTMQILKTITLPEGKVKKGHEGENKIYYYEV